MFDRIRDMLAGRHRDADRAHQAVRQQTIGMMVQGAEHQKMASLRNILLGSAALARKPGLLAAAVEGINAVERDNHAETSSWLTADEIRGGASGRFEACSLLSWLAIAEGAGVPYIPATPILTLTDAEAEAASGVIPNLTGPVPDRIRATVRAAIEADPQAFAKSPTDTATDAPIDFEELAERMHAVMDELPMGTMVRSDQTGANTLKVLACTGLVDDIVPEVSFGQGLEIGPGYVRNGNRRRVDVSDRRITGAYVEGPQRGLTFVARPWVKASRYVEGRDPHRAGTPYDQPGLWPAEWRAFVRNGVVEGVSAYYTWVDAPSALTAARALEVRALAQRIVDHAIARGLEPRFGRIEMARRQNAGLAAALDEQGFTDGSFSAALDFIEGPDGLLLLEGGPGHSPAGGAHPCAFAGTHGPLRMGNAMTTVGVAFRTMAHVNIMEPSTWIDGDRTGSILDWEEVEALAAS